MTNYSMFSNKIKECINDKFESEIHDWDIIKNSITLLINNNIHGAGMNIVDFIDLGNWDHISSFSFDDTQRRLELEWHPNDKFHIYIESIIFFEFNTAIYVFLKGYYNNQLHLNRIYNTKCTSCSFENSGSYMVDIYRVVKRVDEAIQTPNINCYTTCILTRPANGNVTSAGFSRNLMDAINLSLAHERIDSLYNDVNGIQEHDRDSLQEKGNTARRYLEYVLILVNIRLMHLNNVQYQEQMLGSLVSVINTLEYTPLMKNDVQIASDILNACSHYGGVRIDKSDVIFALDFIKNLISTIEKTDINKLQIEGLFKSIQA
ncbi:hypothetical protein DJ535_12045 [Citrobacter murliniae]|uniref:Uncharacterized protein n=2 Tax=Gammaproteobacteria TaxID=1236 RepID=A0ABY2PWF7_9ENTR|nr:hypothetical protein [Citrobacter murliniae]THE38436.1 hypothetical protein DJ535_12045 [Citrobacter murliniae]